MFETEIRGDGTAQLKTDAELEQTRADLYAAREDVRRYARQLTDERRETARIRAELATLTKAFAEERRRLESTINDAALRVDDARHKLIALEVFRKKTELADAIVAVVDDALAGEGWARRMLDDLLGRYETLCNAVQQPATVGNRGEE